MLPGLEPRLRQGLFAEPRTYPAWIRFAGPGPLAPPDMKDNGVLSIGIKVCGVPGPKLLDDEWTQDFTGISAPTFTTPNVFENLQLQRHVLRRHTRSSTSSDPAIPIWPTRSCRASTPRPS